MMNSFRNKFLLIISSLFIINSCTKSNNSVIWKNGVENILSSTIGSASGVFLSGRDIYVAGTCDISAESISSPAGPGGQYAYWKNGIQNNIGNPGLLESIVSISAAG